MDVHTRELLIPDVLETIPALRGYARALTRNDHDADDLVQDTLTKALTNIHRFEPGTSLRAWLFTIMRNTFFNSVQRRKRETTGDADCVSSEVAVEATQEMSLHHNEVIAVVNKLPAQFREMLMLVVVLGERYEDAAVICDCAIGTVKSRVNRARHMVMEMLGRDDESKR
jgi:RNA polymerase sigma-70 factor (ECF subfamily)